jgi:hypothetical protein
MKRRLLLFLCAGCLVAGAGAVVAQIGSQRPVTNFRLPVFNKQGYRIWEVTGASGRFIDKDNVELTSLRVLVLSGDDAATVQWEISSPQANVHPESRTVSGPGQLRVVGRDPPFEIFGDDWTYEHETKTVVIRKKVVATFSGSIGNIIQ